MSTITNKTQVPMVKTADGITFVGPQGRSYTLHKDTHGYDELVQKIREGADGQTLVDFLERDVKRLRDAAKALGDDVAINADAGVVTYKGQEVRNLLTERMLEMLNEGFDLAPMSKFLENLMQNPSMRATNELYGFLEKGNLPITPDGCFLAYKAVRSDFKDIHSGTFDNSVGQTVSMPRNAVDDDKNRTCSYGLHFCSVEYLQHFARSDGHVVILKINPADVVSIPADYNDTKGRCAKYEVVDVYHDFDFNNPTQSLFDKSVYSYGNEGIKPYGTGTSVPTASI